MAVEVKPPGTDKKPGTGKTAEKAEARPKPQTKPRSSGGTGGRPTIESRLEFFFSGIAMGVTVIDEYDGKVISDNAEQLAKAWGQLYRENARVKAIIDRMLEGGAWGQVVIATMGVAVPIAAHHGALPDSVLGFVGAGKNGNDGESAAD
jgi:hypothetical protein